MQALPLEKLILYKNISLAYCKVLCMENLLWNEPWKFFESRVYFYLQWRFLLIDSSVLLHKLSLFAVIWGGGVLLDREEPTYISEEDAIF